MERSHGLPGHDCQYELRFRPLFNEGRAYAFPCDKQGHVDIDALSEHGRNNYLFARAVVGGALSRPVVSSVELESCQRPQH